MSRRQRRRERPATPAEQAAYERVAELVRVVIDAPAGERQAAALQLRRAVDRARDPGNLSNVPGRELAAVLRDRYPVLVDGPDEPEQVRNP